MLTSKQRHDRHDLDPREARVIRIGHYLWRLYKREKRPAYLLASLESVWEAKRQVRAVIAAEREAARAILKQQAANGTAYWQSNQASAPA